MKKKEFKTESKKILNMMINSIYTNEEIFLRELISNASDALDKLYYISLTDKKLKVKKDNLKIKVSFDKDNKTITISDNGIGMTKDELDKELAYTLVQNKPALFTNNEDPAYVPKDDHTPSGIEGILSRYKK